MTTVKYTVAQAPVLASTYLGVQLPSAMEDLKKAFRKQSRKLHPDNQDTGNREAFQDMLAVYEFIVAIAHLPGIIRDMKSNGSASKPVDRFVTTDGTSIFDLGLGLGVTKNGKDCVRCQHKGYTVNPTFGRIRCTVCDESGMVQKPSVKFCRYCNGSGKFRQKNSGRVVSCNACMGSGLFTQTGMSPCNECRSTKWTYGPTGAETYDKCYECKGTGEIEIHNPVIVKGRLF